MIKLIGTNHLMSKETIEERIKEENPDVIGVELCEARAKAFIEPLGSSEKKLNSLLSNITEKIREKAQKQNLDYGSDMKTALNYALDNDLDYIFVDMPIQKIQELFMKIPQEEQIGFQKEIQEFEANFDKIDMGKINTQKVLMDLKNKYPIAFEFLINMRNLYITNQILKAKEKYKDKKILIFLGKGHIEQVEKMLENK
ncbi:MAG: hypothetical protein ACOCT9_02330 [archaeon]